jgi:hypothetical protein
MNNEKFQSVLSDVVWRFHAYGQYGRVPKKAIKALTKRAPGYVSEFYQEQFELNLKLLLATIESVNEAPKHHKAENKYSEYADVDSDYVMNKLRAAFPGQPDEFLKEHLGMTIYWFYLR